MRQTDCRDAVLFCQIEAHDALGRPLVPIRKPGEDEEVRTLDGPIRAEHAERFAANASATHHPSAAGTLGQIPCALSGIGPRRPTTSFADQDWPVPQRSAPPSP